MAQNIMGIINLSENDSKIHDLTHHRPIAAIPFAGRYRVIDFMVSNMVNSGIQKVAIMTRDKFRSLQDHLGPGKYWNLDRKRDGLFMLHPMIDYSNTVKRYGDLQSFKDHIEFISKSRQEYVLISRSYAILNMDFNPAIDYHIASQADITIISKPIGNGNEGSQYIGLDTLQFDENGQIRGVGLNFGNSEEYKLSLEIYIMKRDLLVDIIIDTYQKGKHNFLKQAILDCMAGLKVNMYDYQGNVSFINSITNYYKANMDLLNRSKFNELFNSQDRIYTKIKDEPSTMYTPDSHVKNSIVANGCIIEGDVENSILFRGVVVEKGAVVRNSIIMQDSHIGKSAKVNYIITDKGVSIADGKLLMGDGGVPFVIEKGKKIT